MLCLAIVAKAQLAGNYTIGPIGQDYTTIQSAVNDLYNKGVKAPVVFRLTDTLYNEELALNGPISGSSKTNTVTFATINTNAARIKGNKSVLFKLTKVSNIIIKNVEFYNTDPDGTCIKIEKNSNDCFIQNCSFKNLLLAKNDSRGIEIISSHRIKIENCLFDNVYRAIHLYKYGISGLSPTDNEIIENVFTHCAQGVSTGNDIRTQVEGNDFLYADVNRTSYQVISYAPKAIRIERNYFFKSTGIALLNPEVDSSKNENFVLNNVFEKAFGNALRFRSCEALNVYHNSIEYLGANNGLYMESLQGLKFANNIFWAGKNKGAIYIPSMSLIDTPLLFDYNNFYFHDTTRIGQFGSSNVSSLVQFHKTFKSANRNNVYTNPHFIPNSRLKTGSSRLNNSAFDVGVGEDFNGVSRPFKQDKDSFDIGAYAFSSLQQDLDIVDIGPEVLRVGENEIAAVIQNFGRHDVHNKSIVMSYSTDSGFNWFTDTFLISSLKVDDVLRLSFKDEFKLSTAKETTIWLRIDKGLATDTDNDSFVKTICVGIEGQFVVGNSTSADYANMNDAIAAMGCGVSGPTVFTILDGGYSQVRIPKIKGVSKTNYIIIQGDPTSNVKFQDDSISLLLEGARYIEIRNIIFERTGYKGQNVLLRNGSANVLFDNCLFLSKKSARSGNECNFAMDHWEQQYESYETKVKRSLNINIVNCRFSGGYNSVLLGHRLVNSNIAISHCEFEGFAFSGIYSKNVDSISITNNKFFRSGDSKYAILGFDISNVQISANFISRLSIQVDGKNIWFTNNVCDLDDLGWLSFQQSSGLKMFHNSIRCKSNSYVLFLRSQSEFECRNNIIQNEGTGGAVQAIECKGEVFANNIVYSANVLMEVREGFDEFFYNDIDSVNAFFRANSNLFLNAEFDIKSTELRQMANAPIHDGGYCGVDYDYNGNVRCLISPTIGAYELSKQFVKYKIFSELNDTLYLDQNEELTLDLDLNAPDIGSGSWQIGNNILNSKVETHKLKRTKPGKEIVFLFRNKCISGDTSFRIFTILDTIKPRVTIDSIQYAEQCYFFTPDYKIDESDLDTVIFGGTWPNHTLNAREYVLELSAIDNSGNITNAKSIIKVIDNTPPILKLIGNAVDTVNYWKFYIDKGVEAIDPCNETYEVETWSTTNIDTTAGTGMFTTQYWAKDSSGNVAGPVTRYILKTSVSTNFADKNEVTLYPNPSNGLINLEMNSFKGAVKLELFQIDGQKVFDEEVNASKPIFLNGKLEDRVYLVKITNGSKSYFSKLIIEH